MVPGRPACCGRCRGFTLPELLVVLVVLALLLGLAVPGFTQLRHQQRLQSQAEVFWNSLVLARAQAIRHQQHVTLCTASGSEQCDAAAAWHDGWLVFVDGNRNGRRDDGELLLLRQAPSQGLHMTGNSTVNHWIGYGAEGRSESLSGAFQAGTVSLCARGLDKGWRVVINALGRPRLERTEAAACS